MSFIKNIAFIVIAALNLTLAATRGEQHFVIIITSYNNAEWFERNLGSVFSQHYSNYDVIYVDDCSSDNTAELVEKYVKERGFADKVTIIKNKSRVRALANLYNAVHLCNDDDIVFNYDGDDWFAHDDVFSMINEIYKNPDIWITYGQFQNWPTNELGYCAPIPDEWVEKKMYRKKWWKPGQLRTFRAWLFKQLPLKDLIVEGPFSQGLFFPANADLAVYYPMMEMAGTHFKFIPEVIYIRNVKTPLNDFKANKEIQIQGSKILRGKPVYPTLTQPLSGAFSQYKESRADSIIFSSDLQKTRLLLQSCCHLVLHLQSNWVAYNPDLATGDYSLLEKEFGVMLMPYTDDVSLQQQLHDYAITTMNKHVLLLHDGMVFTHCIDLNACITALEHTFAYGFYLNLHENATFQIQNGLMQATPPLNALGPTLRAWCFDYTENGDWQQAHTIYGALYRVSQLQKMDQGLEQWMHTPAPAQEVGLCYHGACMALIA